MTDREYVESKWEQSKIMFNNQHGKFVFFTANALYMNVFGETSEELYANGAEFTRIREKQITETKEEIEYVSGFRWIAKRSGAREEHLVWSRILARREAVSLDLQRGMKPESTPVIAKVEKESN